MTTIPRLGVNVQYLQNLDDTAGITSIRAPKDIYEVMEKGLARHQSREVAYTGRPLPASTKATPSWNL